MKRDDVNHELINQTVLEDARKLMAAGADVELILLFLRDRRLDQIDSIIAIRALTGLPNAEAKKVVCSSKAWADRFDSVQDLHDKALEALRELAASGDTALPKIELEGFDDSEP